MPTPSFIRLLTLALLAAAAAAAAAAPLAAEAQLPVAVPAPQPPRPPTSPGPVRDPGGRSAPSATPVGKAALAGRVTIASGQPAVGARVMLNGGEGESRMATTDNDGRFVFDRLRGGRYNVMVSKPGYVQIAYGQRRVNSPGTQIPLADGERRQIEILLPRGAVITGMVVDERGEPMINAQVRAMRYTMASGRRRGQQTGGGSTDDRGIYRLHSLQPGEYGICAVAQNRGPVNEAQRIQMEMEMLRRSIETAASPAARQQMLERLARVQNQHVEQTEPTTGYAPSCFPASSPSPSTTLVVAAGEERTGIDIQFALIAVARIAGTIVAPGGQPPRNLQAMLVNADDTLSDIERQGGNVTPDGHFSFQNVPPGRYTITTRSMQMGPFPPPGGAGARPLEDPPLSGSAEVVVAGQDVSDVVIELQRGITVSGQLVVQPTRLTPPGDLSGAQVSLFPFAPDQNNFMFMGPPPQGKVDASGKFTVSDVMPGKYRFSANIGGQGWVLDSITAGAQDVLDFPLEVKAGRDVSGVMVTFGDRVTELSGTLADSKGQPATEQTLLLYTTDQRFWTPQSRRIRIARAADDGQYMFRNVPPGEYRLTTLVDPESGAWYDRELLEQLDSTSVRITLGEGEKKVEHVKIR